jgi:hypothetical protein
VGPPRTGDVPSSLSPAASTAWATHVTRAMAVGFFTAQSQLAHAFTVGSHVVSVTVTDEMQRTITMDLQLDVAAADLEAAGDPHRWDGGP